MSQIGFRWFDLSKGGRLMGLNRQLWVPDEVQEAICGFDSSLSGRPWEGAGRHAAPADDCGCGLWCFDEPDIAIPLTSSYRSKCKAFGAVEWWGNYVQHELGYRTQFMVLRGIWCRIGRIHPAYNVPVYRTFEAMCEVWDVEPVESASNVADWDIGELLN